MRGGIADTLRIADQTDRKSLSFWTLVPILESITSTYLAISGS